MDRLLASIEPDIQQAAEAGLGRPMPALHTPAFQTFLDELQAEDAGLYQRLIQGFYLPQLAGERPAQRPGPSATRRGAAWPTALVALTALAILAGRGAPGPSPQVAGRPAAPHPATAPRLPSLWPAHPSGAGVASAPAPASPAPAAPQRRRPPQAASAAPVGRINRPPAVVADQPVTPTPVQAQATTPDRTRPDTGQPRLQPPARLVRPTPVQLPPPARTASPIRLSAPVATALPTIAAPAPTPVGRAVADAPPPSATRRQMPLGAAADNATALQEAPPSTGGGGMVLYSEDTAQATPARTGVGLALTADGQASPAAGAAQRPLEPESTKGMLVWGNNAK